MDGRDDQRWAGGAAPGWRTDDQGDTRWWDGYQYTDETPRSVPKQRRRRIPRPARILLGGCAALLAIGAIVAISTLATTLCCAPPELYQPGDMERYEACAAAVTDELVDSSDEAVPAWEPGRALINEIDGGWRVRGYVSVAGDTQRRRWVCELDDNGAVTDVAYD